MFGPKFAKVIAEAVKKAMPQQGQPSIPRGGRGFGGLGAVIANAIQQLPQGAGAPRRRGVIGVAQQLAQAAPLRPAAMKKGGAVKSSASKRGDGIAKRGKTKGRMV